MHTIQQRPVALNGQVVIRPMMYLALSYDHRLVDGKEAVTFLIEEPSNSSQAFSRREKPSEGLCFVDSGVGLRLP